MLLPLIMSSTGDMNQNWLLWKQCFLEYMEWHNYNERPEGYKIKVLRNLIGYYALRDPSIHHILNDWPFMHKFCTLIQILERLDHHFCNMKNELVERYNFFRRTKEKDESIEQYVSDLHEKAKTCNFGYLCDSIIRDKVIASVQSKKLRSKLLQTLNLDLLTLSCICKDHEIQTQNVVEKRQTQTNALHSDKIAAVVASNSNNEKVAEKKQNSNDKVNAKVNAKTDGKVKANPKNDNSSKNIIGFTNQRSSDTSDKAKTDSEMHNSGSNILSTACKENNTNIGDKTKTDAKNDKSGKAKTDTKIDNNGSNILCTACKENNTNTGNKTKTKNKNNKSSNNIIGTTNRRHSDDSNKAKTDTKMDNNGSNILSTACRENNNNNGDKTKTDAKNCNNVSTHINFVFGENTNDINDEAKIDSKGMNSNYNMDTANRNSVSSGTQYRQNCSKCNGKHAERACPAWGHKCENCGERNHFPTFCQMKPLKTTEQHINMSSIEHVLNPNHFQHSNQPQPIPTSNYSLVADIEHRYSYLPDASEFCETESE